MKYENHEDNLCEDQQNVVGFAGEGRCRRYKGAVGE